MKATVTVIIPTMLNDSGLFYLVKKLARDKIPTVVVDNQPSAKKRQLTQNPNIIYLPQIKNLGFAAAVNLGARNANTDWLLILNDDIELQPKQSFSQIFSQLINYAQKNKLIAVSPILVNKQGKVENYGYRVLPYGKVELNLDPKDTNIDGLTAACLLIRRNVFLKVSGFDKRFFAYLEDVDLFLTLKKHNYRFAIHPKLSVIHNHLTTSSTLKRGFKEWHDFKNWIWLYFKHSKIFKINVEFIKERARNISGYIKTIL